MEESGCLWVGPQKADEGTGGTQDAVVPLPEAVEDTGACRPR